VEPQGVAHVTVYGTKWCGACKKLQGDLASRGVPFEPVDLEDPKAGNTPSGQRANEIPADMRGSVPVTRVRQRNGQTVWVRGADADRVEKAYRS
jgi:glutaredoxin